MRRDDGGWQGEGRESDLSLSPAQYAAVRQEIQAATAARDEAHLDSALRDGVGDERTSGGRWDRLETSVKSEDSLCRKVATDDVAPDLVAKNKDTNRFTRVYPDEKYTEGVKAETERLNQSGRFERTNAKDNWGTETNKGLNTTWLDRDTGRRFEIQYHTPDSLAATERTHGIYEYSRLDSTSNEDRKVCDYLQYQENKDVAAPAGHETLGEALTQDVPETPDQAEIDRVREAIQEHHEQQHPPVGSAEPGSADPETQGPNRGPPSQGPQQPETSAAEKPGRGVSDDYINRLTQQAAPSSAEEQPSSAESDATPGGPQNHGIG